MRRRICRWEGASRCAPALLPTLALSLGMAATPAAHPRIQVDRPLTCATAITAGAAHVPAGHYGGAPDDLPTGYRIGAAIGRFPTRFRTRNAGMPGTVGAFTVEDNQAWLGQPERREPGGDRGAVTADCDPGETPQPRISLSPLRLYIAVSLARGAPPGPIYLNALVDLDADGRWNGPNGPRDWVVRNCSLTLRPGSIGVLAGCPWLQNASLRTVTSHATTARPGRLYALPPVWCRVVLTRAPLPRALYGPHGWDGAGPAHGFPSGQVEDYLAGAPPPTNSRPGRAAPSPAHSPTPSGPIPPTPRPAPPAPSATATAVPVLPPTFTPTAPPSATPTAGPPSSTPTPIGPPLPYVGATHQYDPATGQILFRLKLAPLAPQNQIYALEWLGPPWTTATAGPAPSGWSWAPVAGGWQASTPGTPLYYGEILYFALNLPPGTEVPDSVAILALGIGGHPLGAITSLNVYPATATPTATGTATPTATATATPLPVPGIASFFHYNPTTGTVVIDVLATSAQGADQVYSMALIGPPWDVAIPGTLSAGWHWQYLQGGQEAATADRPIDPSAGLSLQLTLPGSRPPPSPLVLLAFDRTGGLLGQIVSQPQ